MSYIRNIKNKIKETIRIQKLIVGTLEECFKTNNDKFVKKKQFYAKLGLLKTRSIFCLK